MRHGVRQSCRVAGMCCAHEVTAHECQMGHEQASQQCSKAAEHESKLSGVGQLRKVSRARLNASVIHPVQERSNRGHGSRHVPYASSMCDGRLESKVVFGLKGRRARDALHKQGRKRTVWCTTAGHSLAYCIHSLVHFFHPRYSDCNRPVSRYTQHTIPLMVAESNS
jgi:hypothetical protein